VKKEHLPVLEQLTITLEMQQNQLDLNPILLWNR